MKPEILYRFSSPYNIPYVESSRDKQLYVTRVRILKDYDEIRDRELRKMLQKIRRTIVTRLTVVFIRELT